MNTKENLIYIGPAVGFLILMSIFPLFYSLVNSFHQVDLAGRVPRDFIGLDNYAKIFIDPNFWNALWVTMVYVVTAVGVECLLGFAMALLLWRSFRGNRLVTSIITVPIMLTPVVSALMWRMLYHPDFGIINLSLQGIVDFGKPVQWLANEQYALISIILVDVWQWTPFTFLISLAGLRSLSAVSIEAAKIDGASGVQMLIYIILPLVKPVILVGLLIRSIDAIKVFDYIYVLTMGGPGSSTENLSLYTYLTGYRYLDIGYASALSWIIVILVNILVIFLLKVLFAQREPA